MSNSRLIPITYFNPQQEVRLSAYADTIVLEPCGGTPIIRAIRFGGYPEMVRGMSDAIYAGAVIDAGIGEQNCRFAGEVKRYTRQVSHDGVYAEATLLAKDDEQDARNTSEEAEDTDLPPRKCMIFCPAGDRDRLFEEVDHKTAVPLIPEFRDYVLAELERRGILRRLTVISIREKLDAWVLVCEHDDANIISVIEDGMKSGVISIPGTVKDPDGFDEVNNVTGYLNTFGVTVAERIRNQFEPLFDPAAEPLSPEILAINDYIRAHAGYPLYDAQLAVAESVKRQLAKDKCAFIVAECGSGKTKIGSTAMAAAISAAAGMRAGQKWKKTFIIILCPSHVANKWVRELAETLPETAGVIVRSPTELDKLYALYERGDKSIYAVISKEKARDGYMKRPAAIWSKRDRAFLCPTCHRPIEILTDGYYHKATQFFFRTETRKNHKCDRCNAPLWTAVNPGEMSDWVKIGGYGWVYRHRAFEHIAKIKNEAIREKLDEIQNHPEHKFIPVGACRRYPLSSYIKRRYKGKIDGAIFDELHQYNNNSGQGDAMGEIFSVAKKVVGMTATLINGYSSGIFHLLYRTMPAQMLLDGKAFCAPNDFNSEYGVVEKRFEETDADYASNRRCAISNTRTRQLPGVSPLVYSRFLLEKTAFLSLADMGKALPDYEEIPVALDMAPEVKKEYERIENQLVEVLRNDRKIAQKILSTYLNLLTVYPDQPYDQPPVLHPETGSEIVAPNDTGSFEELGEKEETVLEIVHRKIEAGEKVLVYTSWVRIDAQKKLLKLLTENGYHTEIMSEKIKPDARENWVQKYLAAGMQVLIVNPSLVETGLDLNTFTTLIFDSMGYKLFTLRQASRRSWRINQTAPKVEVYMLYYKDTMQQKAMKLMASKLAVAGIIEGNFSEEGLAAMSDVQDMTSQMAKELVLGIRDNVEDIAASFKKMAIVNPDRQLPQPAPVPETEPERQETVAAVIVPMVPRTPDPEKAAVFAAILEEETKVKRKKKILVNENQMTLFDVA